MVDELSIVKPIAAHGLVHALKIELPAYLTAAVVPRLRPLGHISCALARISGSLNESNT